jgi:hypothetical protein
LWKGEEYSNVRRGEICGSFYLQGRVDVEDVDPDDKKRNGWHPSPRGWLAGHPLPCFGTTLPCTVMTIQNFRILLDIYMQERITRHE